MKKIICIIFLSLFLFGCQTVVPVKQKFPTAPTELFEKPTEMIELKQDSLLSDFVVTVFENYGICHENNVKLEAWQQWYLKTKELYEKEGLSKK